MSDSSPFLRLATLRAAHRPPPPPRGLRVADGVLGMVVAVALPGVSAVWTLIGVTGAERRR